MLCLFCLVKATEFGDSSEYSEYVQNVLAKSCFPCQIYSAYEVKNNNCLFERLFKVKKNGVFLFGISFFVLEIFRFLYYENEGSDDVIDRSTKTIKY